MSGFKDRGIAAEVAVGLLACGAGYFFLARPLSERAEQTRARAENLVAQGYGAHDPGHAGPSVAELHASVQQIAEHARALHERGRQAFNESGMLTAITQLAARHELQLDQLQPVAAKSQRPAATVDPALPPPPDDREIGYTFTVRGGYAALAIFLRQFTADFPNAGVVSMRISSTPEAGAPPVVAIITTRHWAFDAAPVIGLAEAAAGLPE